MAIRASTANSNRASHCWFGVIKPDFFERAFAIVLRFLSWCELLMQQSSIGNRVLPSSSPVPYTLTQASWVVAQFFGGVNIEMRQSFNDPGFQPRYLL